MAFWPSRTLIFSCSITSSLTATAALGQDINYSSVQTVPEKLVQLSYHASAHKSTCAPALVPNIRVTEAPKSGLLTVRKATLTTNKVAGCPNLKIPVEVVFYMARNGYAGPDHVKYEVTDEAGAVADYDVTITVKPAEPASPPPAEKPPGTGL